MEAQTMGAPTIVCVEVERPNGRLRKWEDTLSAHIGQVDTRLREQEVLRCLQADERPFSGRIEYGALGEMLLCKVAATNYQFTRSLTTPTPTLPMPIMLVSVSRGSCKFFQCGHTCILSEGDWTLVDTKQPLGYVITSPKIEAFVMMLPRPSGAAIAALFERGVARQSNGGWGLSRVLHAMVNESFGEMRRLSQSGGRKLGAAITTMTWDALREQIETPPVIGRRDELPMRVKAYIEANLADPELSVEGIAHACSISVRALHRHFAEDPAGSVSHYLWQRRLIRCAEALRDPSQAHRSITDVCFSHGFSSSSHFSRLFKDQFGEPPVRYRAGLACSLRVIRDQS
jgi:AraC family transcriptional regulator, positive regulator of tynA and feaB